MAFTNEITRGMIIKFNNEPHVIVEKEFYKPGKGGAFNRTRLKSIKSGKFFNQIFKSGEKVEEIEVDTKTVQFLYNDDRTVYLMDSSTFEQLEYPLSEVPYETDFLHTEAKYIVSVYEGKIIYLQMPQKITLEVIEAYDAVKGDSSSNPQKEVTVETGAKINVPMFIKKGDKIVINTETRGYFSKQN